MNYFMGARDSSLPALMPPADGFVPFYAKDSDIPQASLMWVLIDEDERSIDDGDFETDPNARLWRSLPAISSHRHGYSYSLDFADGHSEIWDLRDPRTSQVTACNAEQSGNLDLQRLATATVTRK